MQNTMKKNESKSKEPREKFKGVHYVIFKSLVDIHFDHYDTCCMASL